MLDQTTNGVMTHWQLLQDEINQLLPAQHGPYRVELAPSDGLLAQIISKDRGLVADRHRGGRSPVCPLFDAPSDDSTFWIGWREYWAPTGRATSSRLAFGFSSLTVWHGKPYQPGKLQLFRHEWAGAVDLGTGRVEFPGVTAGHPHWQFDVVESTRSLQRASVEKQREILLLALSEPDEEDVSTVEELLEEVSLQAAPPSLIGRFPRVHFASCARWAEKVWNGDSDSTDAHARNPNNLQEVRNWIVSTIHYVTSECERQLN